MSHVGGDCGTFCIYEVFCWYATKIDSDELKSKKSLLEVYGWPAKYKEPGESNCKGDKRISRITSKWKISNHLIRTLAMEEIHCNSTVCLSQCHQTPNSYFWEKRNSWTRLELDPHSDNMNSLTLQGRVHW